jgi:ribosomal protein S18 acetylase RimI-like enzyme
VPPGKWELGFFTQLGLVPSMLRAFGWGRARRSLNCINHAQRHHPKHEHFYLSVLGVDPSFQGRGLGKALMQPVLERCDAQSIPAFLETESENNVRLYKGRGFELTLTEPMPGGGPLIYYMSRTPRRP